VRSALEHKMAGLVWTQVARGELDLPAPWQDTLMQEDIRTWGRHQLLWDGLIKLTDRLQTMGIDVASVKGVTAESRWYSRSGERPCYDVDLLLAPDAIGRVGEIVRELTPDHPLRDSVQDLVDGGHLQSVDLLVDGVHFDMHVDLLKLEIIPMRQRGLIWERLVPLGLPDGRTIQVVDPEVSFIHFLVHLNKDRFAYLLGFADIARICAKEHLDLAFIDRFLRGEGIESHVYLALDAVVSTLGISPIAHPAVGGWRPIVWRRLWPPSFRLRGDIGRFSARHRQFWLALTARGRSLEALRGYLARVLPPPALVSYQTHKTRGPYLWRIVTGRLSKARRERESMTRLEETGSKRSA
jgi:hypothetical protein